jgi:prepilin-type N-terminal cleavage/methylation domain-containing protein
MRRRDAGVTLIELMVVVAIIGILAAVAGVTIKKSSMGAGAFGFSNKVGSELEEMRLRAVASRRWQRMIVDTHVVAREEATTEGLVTPVAWRPLRTLGTPRDVEIASTSPRTHIMPNDGVPAPGANLPISITFSPDGSGQAVTLFVRETNGSNSTRIAVYRTTAASYVYRYW